VDPTLEEWPENDFRLFVGDIAKEVTADQLSKQFASYPSFAKARIIPSHIKGRGYGFVSFLDPMDCAKALREQNGKYLGSRPMAIKKADWKKRDMGEVKKKEKKKVKLAQDLGL
jgi:RNA recognition motif-containing protein